MTATKKTSGITTGHDDEVGETMGERMGESSRKTSRSSIDRLGSAGSQSSAGATITTPVGQSGATEGVDIVGGRDNKSGPGPYVMAAETLKGDSVTNSVGESLGEIKAIMIDVPRGQVAYAVLAFGGVLGIGEKLFAIPWSALTLDADNKCFVLDVDKDQLRQAPGFDKSHWPSMGDETWASGVHSFYGRQPYWQSRL